jgi:hypothetical protein
MLRFQALTCDELVLREICREDRCGTVQRTTVMRRDISSFPAFQWAIMKANIQQFKGNDYKTNRTFIIGVADETVLKRSLNCRTDKLPGFNKSDAIIVTRPSRHRELFINPAAQNHREMQFAFLDALGIYVPAGVAKEYQSDHAFPASAADPTVGLVKAQLIPQPANSTFGASIEKFRKNRRGFPLVGSDIEENLNVTVEMLIGSGLAPAQDRNALGACVDEAIVDIIGDSG